MASIPDSPPPPDSSAALLGRRERMLLASIAAALVLLLVWLRGGLHPEAPLEQLARQSPELPLALADGRPTLVEFYADWCEACRAMAPAMQEIERQHHDELDVVLLNVENPRWQPQLDRYEVNGIPHMEFFDASGAGVGRSVGARSSIELEALSSAVLAGEPLPQFAGVGVSSSLLAATDVSSPSTTTSGPRSHG